MFLLVATRRISPNEYESGTATPRGTAYRGVGGGAKEGLLAAAEGGESSRRVELAGRKEELSKRYPQPACTSAPPLQLHQPRV